MAYTETSRTSYGKRLGNSLKGIVIGFVLFIVGTIMLFWNEGNFVKTQKALQEGQKTVIPVADVSKINPDLNGKFIHASALASTKDTLADDLFGVKEQAIALHRTVAYYQWVEKSKTDTKDKIGGAQEETTTYMYEQEWTRAPVNSSQFKDPQYQGKNSTLAIVDSKSVTATDVSFGAYRLPEFIIDDIQGKSPVKIELGDKDIHELKSRIRKNAGTDSDNSEQIHVSENVVYIGHSSSNPQIGDVRITIEKTDPVIISVLAKVNGNTFEPHYANNGKDISRVAQGALSAENMFAEAHSGNSSLTWIFRLIGLILVIVGLLAMFSIVETLFKILPFLSSIVGVGVGLVVFVVGFSWALLIVAISWMFYRPLIAFLLIAIVVAAIIFLKRRAKTN